MADQMYLDEWPGRYKNLYLFKHKGINLAPWNVKNFRIKKKKSGQISIDGDDLIFFHFHGFKIDSKFNYLESVGYSFDANTKKYIYEPYVRDVKEVFKEIGKIKTGFSSGQKKMSWFFKTRSWVLGIVLPFYWRLT